MKKKIDSDLIFLIGVFLLPFENFFFAPSAGWATITPIIFAIYIIFNINFKLIKEQIKNFRKFGLFLIVIIIFNILAYLKVGLDVKNLINATISIGLGFVNICSMFIYYEKNKNLNKIINMVLISYSITLLFGVLEYLTIKLEINSLYKFFDIIFKRNYMNNDRVQFFFTEPSFIGMHLFGILLPLYMFSKNKNILKLIVIYVAASLIFQSGLRIMIDACAIASIFIIYEVIKKKKYIWLIIIPSILILVFEIGYITNERIQKIARAGIYADGSMSSRYFRIKSSIYGYRNQFPQALIGYGLGNSLIPLRSGYDQAYEEYMSPYLDEMLQLGDPDFNDDSVTYCIYIRLASEFGILFLGVVMYYLIKITKQSSFKYKWPYLLVNLYIYLQFESYAFYAIWIYILAMYYTKKSKMLLIEERKLNEEI